MFLFPFTDLIENNRTHTHYEIHSVLVRTCKVAAAVEMVCEGGRVLTVFRIRIHVVHWMYWFYYFKLWVPYPRPANQPIGMVVALGHKKKKTWTSLLWSFCHYMLWNLQGEQSICRAENGHCFSLFKIQQHKITYFDVFFGGFFPSLSSFRKWLYFYNVGLSSRTICALGPRHYSVEGGRKIWNRDSNNQCVDWSCQIGQTDLQTWQRVMFGTSVMSGHQREGTLISVKSVKTARSKSAAAAMFDHWWRPCDADVTVDVHYELASWAFKAQCTHATHTPTHHHTHTTHAHTYTHTTHAHTHTHMHTTSFNITHLGPLQTKFVYVSHDCGINSDYPRKQHNPVSLWNGDAVRLVWGRT